MDADVAIVGYGPVGQALAGLLGRAGHRVVVFERFTEAALGIGHRSGLLVSARGPLPVAASDQERLRVVSDAIASMTETEALAWSA